MLLQSNYLAKIRQGRQIYYQQGLRFICRIIFPDFTILLRYEGETPWIILTWFFTLWT
jgi:hypothetical protein